MPQQPCIPKYQGQPMTPAQLKKWNALIAKYGKARIHQHAWDWVHCDVWSHVCLDVGEAQGMSGKDRL